eukprot:TRINITY_DN671_c0_g1_i12.p1 TRINITY_DN671_c0_g1~~TRINITY_DN671_c0_g1_i12.p1  ORF type:complete len:881 (-),score=249.82 TRINITY_DN671_c0_g1_i12:476-3118(-)
MQQKLREEEERRKREEEEARLRAEEEARREAEEEARREAERQRKRQLEKEKREQLRKEGKLLSASQQEKASKNAAFIEALKKQGMVPAALLGADGEQQPQKPKRPDYRKKKPTAKNPASDVAEDVAKLSLEDTTSKDDTQETEAMDADAEKQTEAVEVAPEEEEEVADNWEEEEVPDAWDAEDVADDWDAEEESTPKPATQPAAGQSAKTDAKTDAKTKEEPQPKKETKPSAAPTSTPAAAKAKGKAQSDSESDSDSDSEEESSKPAKPTKVAKGGKASKGPAKGAEDDENLRSPICCILGHVDTGKTKLLDKIRSTNVQEGEAGGITQQIGATFFPMESIRQLTSKVGIDHKMSYKVPGLLIIDTPGHESFTNLRSRGSSLCDIAILVVDIMHGLEPQTIESINLLKMRKTPFIVALNKVDRLYGWKTCPNAPIQEALKSQNASVIAEFESRSREAINAFQEQGFNSALWYKNKDHKSVVSLVPTSAISGEGIPDLLLLLIQLTQKFMNERLMYLSELTCTVLEVKVIEGLGTTIDVVLSNGILEEGQTIVVCGLNGPIVTTIRALLTPQPMKELRVKGQYVHHKIIKAAQGVKIAAPGLEQAIAGTQLLVVGEDDDIDDVMEQAMSDLNTILKSVDKSGKGVYVQASTLGSLEALLEFLRTSNIPVSGINIGPVHKKDVTKASVMLEHKKEFATILAFDVKVEEEAKKLAEDLGVRIFTAQIIYHLFDQFTAFMKQVREDKRASVRDEAVFPCILRIIPTCLFNKKDPIVLGMDVVEGTLRVGTPLCVPSKKNLEIGRVFSLEVNKKSVEIVKKGQSVAVKIVGDPSVMVGRHFEPSDEVVSLISRRTIDVLKENFKDDMTKEDIQLIGRLKRVFGIQ